MHARKWLSNDSAVLAKVPTSDRATQLDLSSNDCELPSTKTLGVLWSAESDTFSFRLTAPAEDMVLTKRNILKKVAAVFDPLRFLAPFIVRAKILLQLTWVAGVNWDETVPTDLAEKARKWFLELNQLSQLNVP